MGKKGNWFSAIKRVFTHSSKEKLVDGTEKKSAKEEKKKKKGLGKLKHGDRHSFIPLFREPSSIEKILGEAEREHHITECKPLTPVQHPTHVSPSRPPLHPDRGATVKGDASPGASSSRRTYSTPPSRRVASPLWEATPVHTATPARTPSSRYVQRHRTLPTLREQHVCATKIQAAYRAYAARRNYRALRGLVRLQGVMKSQNVKRQTANALKQMQLMVRVQNQIQSRRIQMLETQVQQRQGQHKNGKDPETAFNKWNLSENTEEWEDSTLTREEIAARMQRKVDAIIKRERAMAYAYSHQLWKTTPGMAQAALMEIRSGGFPYWWNWQDHRQQPPPPTTPINHRSIQSPAAIKTPQFTPTPTRPTPSNNASPLSFSTYYRQPSHSFDNRDTATPRSTKSAAPTRPKLARTPPNNRTHHKSTGATTFKDDDSLMSCPPFSVPHYMSPTVSANAKVRASKERVPNSPSSTVTESRSGVRFSFGQAMMGSFKWKNKEEGSQKGSKGNRNEAEVQTLADHLSVHSTVSMPTTVGRKPFNRFV